MEDANVDRVDALFASNMLADEIQGQKHIASLIAEEANLFGVEALQVRAAMAGGAAAIRVAFLSVASGEAAKTRSSSVCTLTATVSQRMDWLNSL
jgi:acetyl-CoA C-acetyltransferase